MDAQSNEFDLYTDSPPAPAQIFNQNQLLAQLDGIGILRVADVTYIWFSSPRIVSYHDSLNSQDFIVKRELRTITKNHGIITELRLEDLLRTASENGVTNIKLMKMSKEPTKKNDSSFRLQAIEILSNCDNLEYSDLLQCLINKEEDRKKYFTMRNNLNICNRARNPQNTEETAIDSRIANLKKQLSDGISPCNPMECSFLDIERELFDVYMLACQS